MNADKILISGGLVLDPGSPNAELLDILIKDGRILALLPPGQATSDNAYPINARGRLLIPGLVNAHTHSHLSFAKGIHDRWNLELHLNAGPWTNVLFTHEERRVATMLSAAEMISKGCTAAYDLHFEIPEPTSEGMETVADAYMEAGMRVLIAPMLADRSIWQAIPGLAEAIAPETAPSLAADRDPELLIEDLKRLIRGWSRPSLMAGLALAPTIPLHCSEALLRGCARLSEAEGVALHMHLAESKLQAVAGKARYSETLTKYLSGLGILSPRFTAAHAVWMDDEDLDILAKFDVKIAHNPASNLRLGSGIAPARSMLNRGLSVGIGTDASSCADGLNMFEALRSAALVSRVMSADPAKWLTSLEAFEMATTGSAKALGLESEIGRLSPGFQADIVFLDLDHLNYVPLNNPLQQMVFAENAAAIRRVMVAGCTVYEDGAFTRFDVSLLKQQAHAAASEIRGQLAERRAQCERLAPTLLQACLCMTDTVYLPERRFECL